VPVTTHRVAANGVEIAYEQFGRVGDPLILLVMGLGSQMIAWPDPFCAALADAGYHVVRFDNRDVGLSTHFHDVPPPRPLQGLLPGARPPYGIADMADDALELLDALDVDAAHVVGVSMGGFIAQTMALLAPERVRSLSLIMTSTGSRRVGHPRPRVALMLARRRPAPDRAAAIDTVVETFRAIGSPGYPFDEPRVRDLAGRAYDRSYDPAGYRRQLAAATGQPDRTAALAAVHVPTVVLHGLSDPLVHVSGGLALARAIRQARFVGFPGMGHDLPEALWPRYVAEILGVARAADGGA
jgi:pimeloyl-ACP methyl ester carboxylesterase